MVHAITFRFVWLNNVGVKKQAEEPLSTCKPNLKLKPPIGANYEKMLCLHYADHPLTGLNGADYWHPINKVLCAPSRA
ncbi:hypothetical protein DBR40_05395 [Pedobacter sp. KBW01]|nr:hypothetical protein DBR40_05395 [Pedobacter sp. KBW01]